MRVLALREKWYVRFLLCLIFGWMIGMLLVHLGGEDFLNQGMDLYLDRIGQLKSVEIDSSKLFFLLLYKREIVIILFSFLGLTSIGKHCAAFGTAWIGMSLGSCFSCVLKLRGAKGILLFFALLFPQWLVYLSVFLFLFYFITVFSVKSGRHPYKKNIWKETNMKLYFQYFCSFVFLAVVVLFGVFLEAFINPLFIKKL